MSDRKYTIITVCKNEGNTLEETILSVKNQTYKNFEHIVVDGKSTDNTANILEKYKNDVLFISEQDRGVYDAMNKGLKLASGCFVIFINANDYFYDEKVIKNIDNLIEKKPDVDFIYGQGVFVELENSSKIVSIISNESIKNAYDLLDCGGFNHQAIFYKKSLFEKYGLFSTDYKIVSDNLFNFECVLKHKCKVLLTELFISKRSTGGVSTSNSDRLKKELVKLKKKYFPFYRYVSLVMKLIKYFCPKLFEPLNKFVKKLKNFNKINYV